MNNLKSKNNICISGVDIISKYVIQYLKMIYDVQTEKNKRLKIIYRYSGVDKQHENNNKATIMLLIDA